MTVLGTSRIWQVWQAVYDQCLSIVWPTLPDPVEVYLGDVGRSTARNVVIVYVNRESSQDWATIGQRAKDDEFDVVIDFRVWNPGDTAQEAKDKLQQVSDAIESEIRTNYRGPSWGDLDGVAWMHVASVLPDVVITDEGWAGFGQIVVHARCRI